MESTQSFFNAHFSSKINLRCFLSKYIIFSGYYSPFFFHFLSFFIIFQKKGGIFLKILISFFSFILNIVHFISDFCMIAFSKFMGFSLIGLIVLTFYSFDYIHWYSYIFLFVWFYFFMTIFSVHFERWLQEHAYFTNLMSQTIDPKDDHIISLLVNSRKLKLRLSIRMFTFLFVWMFIFLICVQMFHNFFFL